MNPVRIHHISAFMLTPQYLKNHLQMKMNYFASMWLLHTRTHTKKKTLLQNSAFSKLCVDVVELLNQVPTSATTVQSGYNTDIIFMQNS
jgi:hypothetical protein